jgi:anti-sigma factor RsiW
MLLHAYIDGEIDAASTMELETRIAVSPELRQELERLSALHSAVQTRATRFTAPPRLHTSLPGAIDEEQADSIPSEDSWWWRTLAIGTTAAAGALLLWALAATFSAREDRRFPAEAVVNAHVRSLMVDHLTDLASAERHSVKPWLSNRLDFAPPVHDLAGDGFVLVGGRLDYIDGKPAAAIVYRYRQHVINVFVWPAAGTGDGPITLSVHRGYNAASFVSSGMSYWAVSDLNQSDLNKLAQLLQSRSAIK